MHFWEIKPDIEVYGTSGMIGIATSNLDVESATRSYHLGLGRDKDGESWGYNYKGEWVHRGVVIGVQRPPVWGLGSIIGVLLDRWKGTLEYYLNREPLGVAFRGKIINHMNTSIKVIPKLKIFAPTLGMWKEQHQSHFRYPKRSCDIPGHQFYGL